jgi:hypothetical protein
VPLGVIPDIRDNRGKGVASGDKVVMAVPLHDGEDPLSESEESKDSMAATGGVRHGGGA